MYAVQAGEALQVCWKVNKIELLAGFERCALPCKQHRDGGGVDRAQFAQIDLGLARLYRAQTSVQHRFCVAEDKRRTGSEHDLSGGLARFGGAGGKPLVSIRQRLDQSVNAALVDLRSKVTLVGFHQPGAQDVDIVDFPAVL